MNSLHPASTLKNTLALFFGLGLLAALPLHADLNGDLAFSGFSNVDVSALAGGQVLQIRGALLDFQRGITAQSLYMIDAAPASVSQKLTTWNPGAHSELKVWIHHALPARPTPADFSSLASLPDNSSVNYLVDATENLDPAHPALQLDKSEAQAITGLRAQITDKKALFTAFWSQILAGRVGNFLDAKLASANYSVSGGDVRSMDDLISLIRSDSKVYRDFHPLFSETPLYASTKAVPAGLYFECFDVQGYGALGTGAIFQMHNGTAIQSADIEYFANSGIYTTVELEKIWPITVGGKTETLVWREDLVSTSNVAYLHGMERLASSMLMLQDVKQGIEAFRAEFK